MNKYLFDIEADSLDATKIHCMSVAYRNSKGEFDIASTTNYDNMRSILSKADVLIGHNIILWDIPTLERILDIKIGSHVKLVDTLALSWYLEPTRKSHGLESYGEDFGVPKPKIDNWETLPIKEYIHRCQEDVKINLRLYEEQIAKLSRIYDDIDGQMKLISYLMFKMRCARLQQDSRWKLNIPRVENAILKLEAIKEEKESLLREAMPRVPITSKMSYPKRPRKKDGSLSAVGQKWYDELKKQGLPEDHLEDLEIVRGHSEPNPSSHKQVKDWLFSLGWEPTTFKYSTDSEGNEKKIPQVKQEFGESLCPSVMKLVEREPAVENLEGISIINHRLGILKGFLRDVSEDGYLTARVMGLTNTLRFIHTELVNLPKVDAPYAEDIRSSLIAPEGHELCGSDMSSLEDRTKQHYMWVHDPEYVKEMMVDDFDPHLALAEFAGALTPEQVKAHKEGRENHKEVRHIFKTANYACTYGAGATAVSRSAGISKNDASKVVKAYRKKNWAIDTIADKCKTKTVDGQMWLYNPVSGLYYSLRYEKDKFSTLNQGTGVYCFDLWVGEVLRRRPQLTGQFHDEIILTIEKGKRDEIKNLLKNCVIIVNEKLNLNRELDIDVQFGNNYGEIH